MYTWIWRHLPFGLPGKIIGSALLVAGLTALLWFIVFPAVEPILPFNDVQVTDEQEPAQDDPGIEPTVPAGDNEPSRPSR